LWISCVMMQTHIGFNLVKIRHWICL